VACILTPARRTRGLIVSMKKTLSSWEGLAIVSDFATGIGFVREHVSKGLLVLCEEMELGRHRLV